MRRLKVNSMTLSIRSCELTFSEFSENCVANIFEDCSFVVLFVLMIDLENF